MKTQLVSILGLTLVTGFLGAQCMYGAFKIVTEPKGAEITLTGSNQNLGTTPSQIFPIFQDEYTSYANGIPGRVFHIQLSKPGYLPLYQEIFVPYNSQHQQHAINNPTLFSFRLQRQGQQYNSYCPPPVPRPWLWMNFWHKPPRRPHHNWHYNPPQPPPPPPGGGYGSHGGTGSGHGSHGGSGGGNHGNNNNNYNPPPPPGGGHGGHPRP